MNLKADMIDQPFQLLLSMVIYKRLRETSDLDECLGNGCKKLIP
jgi:hypothetical protein